MEVTDKESIAEGFDKFFSMARTKLADKIRGQKARSGAPFEHTFYFCQNKKSSEIFSFQRVDPKTILKTIQHFKSFKVLNSFDKTRVLRELVGYLMYYQR